MFTQLLSRPNEVPTFLEVLYMFYYDWKETDGKTLREHIKEWWGRTPHTYVKIMLWKLTQIVKITLGTHLLLFIVIVITVFDVGYWDWQLIRSCRIREKADEFDEDPNDEAEHDIDVLVSVGQSLSLFWQLFPATMVISKFGEAMNVCPLYIDDEAMTKPASEKWDEKQNEWVQEPELRGVPPFTWSAWYPL